MATEHVPPGLVEWIRPRLYDSMVQAMLEGIEAAEKHVDESRWRRSLHSLQQTGGVFETSGFGDRMRSMPAIETVMIGRFSGYGQLWGQEWEYVDPAAMSPRVGR